MPPKAHKAFGSPHLPSSSHCKNAYIIVRKACEVANSFHDSAQSARKARGGQGAPTDSEQDLLRAMLAFASAGLDASAKQLVRDALPRIIDMDDRAHKSFEASVLKKLESQGKMAEGAFKLLAAVVTARNPRESLVVGLINELCADSLQSAEQIYRVASHFNVESSQIQKPGVLRDAFRVRNEIVHEMDIDFSKPNRKRRARQRDDMVAHTETILQAATNFLDSVDKKLVKPN